MAIKREKIFRENPYDLETLFESLEIAGFQNKELLYVDKLVTALRSDPTADLTSINYAILKELRLLKFETAL